MPRRRCGARCPRRKRGKRDSERDERIVFDATLSLQRRLERNLAGAALDLDAVLDRQIEAERVALSS